jgi:hypothetical protein
VLPKYIHTAYIACTYIVASLSNFGGTPSVIGTKFVVQQAMSLVEGESKRTKLFDSWYVHPHELICVYLANELNALYK